MVPVVLKNFDRWLQTSSCCWCRCHRGNGIKESSVLYLSFLFGDAGSSNPPNWTSVINSTLEVHGKVLASSHEL